MSNIRYVPVNTRSRSLCEKINDYYSEEEKIIIPDIMIKYSEGRSSNVYDICKNKDCNYVLKVITYDDKKSEFTGVNNESIKKIWLNEVDVLKKLNNYQDSNNYKFVPDLIDYWYCENNLNVYYYILIEKYSGNLYDFIKKYKSNIFVKSIVLKSLEVLELQLNFIHDKCNICLNDIKLDNILYKQVDKYAFEFVFANTGLSTMETDENCKKNDTERFRRHIKRFVEQLDNL